MLKEKSEEKDGTPKNTFNIIWKKYLVDLLKKIDPKIKIKGYITINGQYCAILWEEKILWILQNSIPLRVEKIMNQN